MKQVQLSDRQSSFIFYLVHQGKGRTEAARLAALAVSVQKTKPAEQFLLIRESLTT